VASWDESLTSIETPRMMMARKKRPTAPRRTRVAKRDREDQVAVLDGGLSGDGACSVAAGCVSPGGGGTVGVLARADGCGVVGVAVAGGNGAGAGGASSRLERWVAV